MIDKSSSDPPTDVHESVMNIPARIAEVELDKKGDSWSATFSSTSNHCFFLWKREIMIALHVLNISPSEKPVSSYTCHAWTEWEKEAKETVTARVEIQ